MELSYRYRLYPTAEQADALLEQMRLCRWVWNQALDVRQRMWGAKRETVGYGMLCRHLTAARAELSWLAAGSCDAQQQAVRELCAAYGRTFAARRTGKRAAQLPGFRSVKRGSWRTVRDTRNGHRIDDDRLRVAGVPGTIDVRLSRQLASEPKSVTVTCDPAGRWHASFRVDVDVDVDVLPVAGRIAGIDLGVACAYATSAGHVEPNPRHLRRRERALRRSQRAFARKERGSANRRKAKTMVAREHVRVADARRDFQHQQTTRLVRDHDLICVETLAVANLTRSAKATVERSGRKISQKAGLNRAILDVGWSQIVMMLDYKTRLYGRELRRTDRWYPSSKTCSACGHARTKLPLAERTYHCEHCGLVLDRDVNAARNILAAGLAESQSACGERARPVGPRPRRQRSAKQETSPATVGIPHLQVWGEGQAAASSFWPCCSFSSRQMSAYRDSA